jgi:hypothetical protein
MFPRSLPRRIALFLALCALLLAGPARAADTGNGSKNFRTPTSVPNYFSNEAGPMLGPGSETRRGPLYMSQTYGTPPPVARVEAPVAAAPPPQYRQRVAMAEPRGRVIRGRRGERVVAHHITVHGRSVTRVVAHGSSRGRVAHVASRGHVEHVAARGHGPTHQTTRVGSSTHRRGRG